MFFVNDCHPDTEYLYYPLDMEGVTLKGSLLPANIKPIIIIIMITINIIRVATKIAFNARFNCHFNYIRKNKLNLSFFLTILTLTKNL